ncbi:MAG: 2-oxo acid dehydrogenase subunit E2, partial [Candidatus Dormibacteraceae bacterium]
LELGAHADPSGRVTLAAVRAAAGAAAPADGTTTATGTLGATRRAIAARMVRAHEAPHITLSVEVRFAELLGLRERWAGDRPSITAMIGAATCRALSDHPLLNSTFEGGVLTTAREVNLGFAVARPEGLVVPVVQGAGALSVDALSDRLAALVGRARAGGLGAGETSNGTFTITSLGAAGVDHFAALINPPQVAILAVGRVADRVLPIAGGVGVVSAAHLSLTTDHRVVDGHPGALFLATLKELLEAPGWMRGS